MEGHGCRDAKGDNARLPAITAPGRTPLTRMFADRSPRNNLRCESLVAGTSKPLDAP